MKIDEAVAAARGVAGWLEEKDLRTIVEAVAPVLSRGPQPVDVGVTVSAAELGDALNAVSAFTIDPDAGLPAMECVRFDIASNGIPVRLGMSATDRYTAGYAQITAAGSMPPVLVHFGWVRLLIKSLRKIAKHSPGSVVHLRVIPGLIAIPNSTLEITADDGWFALRVPTRHAELGHFPPLDGLFARAAGNPVGVDAPIGLDLARVERFARVAEIYQGCTQQWHFGGLGKPVRIQIGETFTGLVIPTKLEQAPALIPVTTVQAGA